MRASNVRALLAVSLLVAALPVIGADVAIGPEIPITRATVEALPGAPSQGETVPLWTGQEWLFAWSDPRNPGGAYPGGVYMHRLGWNGNSLDDVNRFVRPGVPDGLVRFGTGYLLAAGGIHRLDHSGAFVERVLESESRVLAADASVLAWHTQLTSATLFAGSSTITVDVGRLTGGLSPWQEPAVATDGASYLVTWIHHPATGGGTSSVRYNIIGPAGEIVLDQPGIVVANASRAASLVAGWDGAKYLIGWATQTASGPWDLSLVALEAATGIVSEPRSISTGAGWNWSRPQMIETGSDQLLLVWTELVLGSGSTWMTWGRFVESGIPVDESFLISEEPVVLGFDGGNRFAGVTRSATARLFSRVGFDLEPVTGTIPLRYGLPERFGLAINDFDPFATWLGGGPYAFFLNAGLHTSTTQVLVPQRISDETVESASHAASHGRRLVAWTKTTPTSRKIRYMMTDLGGAPLSEPSTVEPGSSPTVVAHAEGWLLIWESAGLLRLAFVGADGRLRNLPENLADPEPQPYTVADRQTGIGFVPVNDDETLAIWQEGEFPTVCRLSACPVAPAPASIRSIVIRDGTADLSTLRSHGDLGIVGRPAAIRVGQRVLLVAVRQLPEFVELARIEGIELDLAGNRVREPFTIRDGVGPFDVRTPDLVRLGSSVLAIWARERDADRFVGELEGALIEEFPGGDPVIQPIELDAPNLGARSHLLVAETDSRAALYYTRRADAGTWNGTLQIFARTIHLDSFARRRSVSRR